MMKKIMLIRILLLLIVVGSPLKILSQTFYTDNTGDTIGIVLNKEEAVTLVNKVSNMEAELSSLKIIIEAKTNLIVWQTQLLNHKTLEAKKLTSINDYQKDVIRIQDINLDKKDEEINLWSQKYRIIEKDRDKWYRKNKINKWALPLGVAIGVIGTVLILK